MSISPYRKTIADFPFISVLLRRTNIPHRINAPAGCICSGSPFSPVYMPIIPLSDLQERAHFRGIRRTNRSSVRNRRVPRQNRRQPLFTAPSDSTDCMSTRRNRLRGFPTHSQHATKERTGEKLLCEERESRGVGIDPVCVQRFGENQIAVVADLLELPEVCVSSNSRAYPSGRVAGARSSCRTRGGRSNTRGERAGRFRRRPRRRWRRRRAQGSEERAERGEWGGNACCLGRWGCRKAWGRRRERRGARRTCDAS